MDEVAVIGLDLHKEFSQAVTMNAAGKVLTSGRVGHASCAAMAEYFDQFAPGTDVVMEASFNWPWIADLAEAKGLRPHLGHAVRIRELAKGMAKNDRKDATLVAKLWLAGDIFPDSYLAPAPVRSQRGRFRMRSLLVKMRSQIKNSVHGVLHKHNARTEEVTDLFGRRGRSLLVALALPPDARDEVDRKLAVLDDLAEHIQAIEKQLHAELTVDPRAALLQTMPGVGEIIAYGWLAEIGDIARFPDRRALAAYAGLLPLDNASAGEDHGKHTNRRCNQHLRMLTIEAVHSALRSSPRMRALFQRVRSRNTATPGKAIIAVARELLEIAHLLLTRQVPYCEVPPTRPGASPAAPEGLMTNDHSEPSRTLGSRRASQVGRSADQTQGQAVN